MCQSEHGITWDNLPSDDHWTITMSFFGECPTINLQLLSREVSRKSRPGCGIQEEGPEMSWFATGLLWFLIYIYILGNFREF